MNVKQLRDELSGYPDDWEVIMSSDGEGNNKSPVSDLEEAMYLPTEAWYGQTWNTNEYNESHSHLGYTEEDNAPENAFRVVLLWPVN